MIEYFRLTILRKIQISQSAFKKIMGSGGREKGGIDRLKKIRVVLVRVKI
jgi:hypothetical protein